MLVSETADCFRATITALRSHGEGKVVSFHTFSIPEGRCIRLLLKKVGMQMPEPKIKDELEALLMNVQAVMQLRSKSQDQDSDKDRPLTPHFILSVARGLDVGKLRPLTALCCLQVPVETYRAPKGPPQFIRCQRFGHTQRNCSCVPR
jgi:hypothetical protein